jgi:hypothetical protein
VSSFDVRVFAIRRRPGRKAFEVRWRVAGHDKSRSFMTRALADGTAPNWSAGARRSRRRPASLSPGLRRSR